MLSVDSIGLEARVRVNFFKVVMVVNKSLLLTGLLIAMAASQVPTLLQKFYASSASAQAELLLAQRSCNPNDPSYCP
jgi:hypothetical protein